MSYDYTGYIKEISKNIKGETLITIATDYSIGDLASEQGAVDVSIKKHRKKRSLDANALLWVCLGKIANELRCDKWEVYLRMLKRYGQYTYICVKPEAVEGVKRQWRECEEIGEVDINGRKATQLLCYYGSSHYDSREFSILLEGVFSEMKEIGLISPPEEELERAIELWKKNH